MGRSQENPLKPNPLSSPACCCHGDPWGQLRAQHNCPLIWGRCILMDQITRLNLIVVFNLHYWRESNGQTLGVSFPHTRKWMPASVGPVEYLVASFPLSSTISILGWCKKLPPHHSWKKSFLFLLIALSLLYFLYLLTCLAFYFQDTSTNKSLWFHSNLLHTSLLRK